MLQHYPALGCARAPHAALPLLYAMQASPYLQLLQQLGLELVTSSQQALGIPGSRAQPMDSTSDEAERGGMEGMATRQAAPMPPLPTSVYSAMDPFSRWVRAKGRREPLMLWQQHVLRTLPDSTN